MKRIDKMYKKILTAINGGAYYHGLWLKGKTDKETKEYYYKEYQKYVEEINIYINIIVDVFDVAAVDALQHIKNELENTFIKDENRQAVYDGIFYYSKGYYKF